MIGTTYGVHSRYCRSHLGAILQQASNQQCGNETVRLFFCQSCNQALMFENTDCERCGHRLGYLPDRRILSAVEPDGGNWIALSDPDARYRFCRNWEQHGCNWMVPANGADSFCTACRHNRTIPDLSDPANRVRWQKVEAAKHRLVYSLINLDLPLPTVASGGSEPIVFDFPADPADPSPRVKVMTGHHSGVITISLAEADDATREQNRVCMGEPYRTLLGHFRHEIGHYYWDRLVRDCGCIDSCRAIFGDDSQDYGAALRRYHAQGAPRGWQSSFVSAYASMHPWEDFAETFAHFLHIVDTLETAKAFGIRIHPRANNGTLEADVNFDSYHASSIGALIKAWFPLTFAVNSINRSMGQPDLYPFILSPVAIAKLGYIDALVHNRLDAS
jgi:hypothetical protein